MFPPELRIKQRISRLWSQQLCKKPRELVGPSPALSLFWRLPWDLGEVRRMARVTGGAAQYGKRSRSAVSVGEPGTLLNIQKWMKSFFLSKKR